MPSRQGQSAPFRLPEYPASRASTLASATSPHYAETSASRRSATPLSTSAPSWPRASPAKCTTSTPAITSLVCRLPTTRRRASSFGKTRVRLIPRCATPWLLGTNGLDWLGRLGRRRYQLGAAVSDHLLAQLA